MNYGKPTKNSLFMITKIPKYPFEIQLKTVNMFILQYLIRSKESTPLKPPNTNCKVKSKKMDIFILPYWIHHIEIQKSNDTTLIYDP